MNVSLKQFFTSRYFGDIHPESPERKIKDRLGLPDQFRPASADEASRAIWKYGSVEFSAVALDSIACRNIVPMVQSVEHDERVCETIFIEGSGSDEQGPFFVP